MVDQGPQPADRECPPPRFSVSDRGKATTHEGAVRPLERVRGFARGDAPHTNHQQFFITLSDQSWLQTKAVAFGRVVKGLDAIRQIGSLPLKGERPVENVIIANCNVVNLVDGFGLGHGGGM